MNEWVYIAKLDLAYRYPTTTAAALETTTTRTGVIHWHVTTAKMRKKFKREFLFL